MSACRKIAYGGGTVPIAMGSVFDKGYRYGFGGHEKIDEVSGSGNTVDMGDRWLDVRLGRTPKPDAKAHTYPDISPYSYALNSPTQFVDPDGKVVVDPKTSEQVVKVDGQWKTASGGSVSKEFIENSQPVLDKLTASEVGRKIYVELQNIRTIVVIDLSDKKNINNLKQGGNSLIRTGDEQFTTGDDSLYDGVVITPDLNKIETQAKAAGKAFGGKTMTYISKPENVNFIKKNGKDKVSYLNTGELKNGLRYVKENDINFIFNILKPIKKNDKDNCIIVPKPTTTNPN